MPSATTKIKHALATARAPWGVGWSSLTAEHRNALVVSALVGQFVAVDYENISTETRSARLVEWQTIISDAMRSDF